MARLLSIDAAFTDTTIPKLLWVDDYVARIKATLSPTGWWDMATPANYTAVAGKLSLVTDISGNGLHLSQATDANRPPVNTSFFGAINGVNRGAATFDGATDLYMKTSTTPFDGTGVWTMVRYEKLDITSAAISVPASQDSSTTFASFFNAGSPLAFSGSVAVAGNYKGISTARITRISYPGSGNAALYDEVNGLTASASVAVAAHVPSGQLQIGGYQSSRSNKFIGGLAEVMLFKSDLTLVPASMQLIRDYLAFKYR